MGGFLDAILNPGAAREALGIKSDVDKVVANPVQAITNPVETLQAGMRVAKAADNAFVQDAMADTAKDAVKTVSGRAAEVASKIPGGEGVSSAITSASDGVSSGVDMVVSTARSIGLDKTAADMAKALGELVASGEFSKIAQGLKTATTDGVTLPSGIPGTESTLTTAPPEVQKLAADLAKAAASALGAAK